MWFCKRIKDFKGRTFWKTLTGKLSFGGCNYDDESDLINTSRDDALLVGSLCGDGKHLPVLDLDFGVEVVPSTTPGHHHLYLNKALSWRDHKKLLKVLRDIGMIEKGFYKLCMKRRQSFVLLPGINKHKIAA